MRNYIEMDRIYYEVFVRTGKIIDDGLDSWIEAVRLVTKWQKGLGKSKKAVTTNRSGRISSASDRKKQSNTSHLKVTN